VEHLARRIHRVASASLAMVDKWMFMFVWLDLKVDVVDVVLSWCQATMFHSSRVGDLREREQNGEDD
jgi:hypothetical protein